MENFPVTV